MSSSSTKSAAQIPVKVSVKKFSNANSIEEFDIGRNSVSSPLSSKIAEFMVRIGDSNDFCFNIVIQLLTTGKVRVDFRDSTERLQLANKLDVMSRAEAVKVFDHWVRENRTASEEFEATRKVVVEPPPVKLPKSF